MLGRAVPWDEKCKAMECCHGDWQKIAALWVGGIVWHTTIRLPQSWTEWKLTGRRGRHVAIGNGTPALWGCLQKNWFSCTICTKIFVQLPSGCWCDCWRLWVTLWITPAERPCRNLRGCIAKTYSNQNSVTPWRNRKGNTRQILCWNWANSYLDHYKLRNAAKSMWTFSRYRSLKHVYAKESFENYL